MLPPEIFLPFSFGLALEQQKTHWLSELIGLGTPCQAINHISQEAGMLGNVVNNDQCWLRRLPVFPRGEAQLDVLLIGRFVIIGRGEKASFPDFSVKIFAELVGQSRFSDSTRTHN